MLTVTQNAQEVLQRLMDNSDKPLAGLRIAAVNGGCAGLQYRLDLVTGPEEGDHLVESGSIKLFIVPDNAEMLIGTVIDFAESLEGSGFTFANPNAASKCSCGKSFAA
ncbi:iron-sulfur cluster assembly accessory protein [Cohaesibacter sp. ES.047]|uniref:HesB/IscA family protein n=1 Tax=Cohaesibacter sp. ES.047 TaxID=1798205 RepID=UPI000BB6A491|nr:iron-sulfur cluster assembly accessory protein [Cohaesibacter sp. ES.047]